MKLNWLEFKREKIQFLIIQSLAFLFGLSLNPVNILLKVKVLFQFYFIKNIFMYLFHFKLVYYTLVK